MSASGIYIAKAAPPVRGVGAGSAAGRSSWPRVGHPHRIAREAARHYHAEPARPSASGATSPGPNSAVLVAERLGGVVADLQHLAEQEVTPGDVAGLDRCFEVIRRLEGAVASVRSRVVTAAALSKAHQERGERDTTAYLKGRLGLSGREAKRQAELARGLNSLPETRAALANGEIGEEQASAVARASRTGRLGEPQQVESELLEIARAETPERLNQEIRRREQQADRNALLRDENAAHRRRRANSYRRDDGTWDLNANLDPVNGEIVDTAINAFTQPDPAGTPEELRRTREQRFADGLVAMAQAALASGEAQQDGGIRPHLSVHVPIEAFVDRGSVLAQTEAGTLISPEALERLGCDSCLSRIVTSGTSQVLDVGRSTRSWSGPQRRAVVARDVTCRWPGCTMPASRTIVHHVRFWSNGGDTSVDNGVLLCHHHHRQVHEGRWELRLDPGTGEVVVRSPSGAREMRGRPPGRGSPAG
jgi:hypothetical protein